MKTFKRTTRRFPWLCLCRVRGVFVYCYINASFCALNPPSFLPPSFPHHSPLIPPSIPFTHLGYFSIIYSLEQATIGGSSGLTIFMKLATRVWPIISCPVRLKLAFTLGYVITIVHYLLSTSLQHITVSTNGLFIRFIMWALPSQH